MARRTRLTRPPQTGDRSLNQWLEQVHSAINDLPNFSITSYGDLNSVHTGFIGDLAIDVSGGQGHLWIKHDDGSETTLWNPVALTGYGILFSEEGDETPLAVTASNYSDYPATYAVAQTGVVSATTGDEAYFTINSEGTYLVNMTSSFTADANTVWDCDLFQNGSELSFGWQRGIGASALPGSAAFQGIVHANSGDSVIAKVKHDNVAAKGLTPLYTQFTISKLL